MLPASPRHLANKGQDQECLEVLARLRMRDMDHPLVVKEWLEIRSEVRLNKEVAKERHPNTTSSISEFAFRRTEGV